MRVWINGLQRRQTRAGAGSERSNTCSVALGGLRLQECDFIRVGSGVTTWPIRRAVRDKDHVPLRCPCKGSISKDVNGLVKRGFEVGPAAIDAGVPDSDRPQDLLDIRHIIPVAVRSRRCDQLNARGHRIHIQRGCRSPEHHDSHLGRRPEAQIVESIVQGDETRQFAVQDGICSAVSVNISHGAATEC